MAKEDIKEKEDKVLFKIDTSKEIPPLPDYKTKEEIDVKYPLIPPYAYAHIHWDEEAGEVKYDIKEPELSERENKILEILEEGVRELINLSFISVKEKNEVIAYLEKNIKVLLNELSISVSSSSFLKLMYYIYRDFVGLNEVEPLLNDYYIEDIECNGVNSPVYVVHRKYRNLSTNLVYKSIDGLTSFVEKLAQKCGKYISYANPLLDGSLPDGSRINATYTQEISSKGPTYCFVDGYFQLGNGEVLEIEELFDECKKNFGVKIEEGNEVIKPKNMTCCGVDEKNLNQFNSKLKTIIKLQPPKKLVKVELEDGSKITTTKNHLFHIADSNLGLIKAEELKEGMFVPIPTKINIEGCLQKINIANIIKDFSYIHKTCVVSTSQIKEIINNNILNYQKQHRNHRQIISQKYGIHNSYFYEIISRGSSISFEILNEMCEDVNGIGDLKIIVYGGGTKGKSKAIKVPKEVDEDLAYLAGAIISDGYLCRNAINISCFEEGFREAVLSKLIKKFGKAEAYYNKNRVYVCNLFVPFFFNKVFGIPYGKKHDIAKVPKIIFKSDNKIIRSFMKGLFDGDGSCKSGLSYKTNSKRLAEELTYLLTRIGIYSKINFENKKYRVIIPSIYEEKYFNKIGFNNKSKSSYLKKLLDKKYSDAKSYIRSGRIPAKPVLELIKELGLSKNKLVNLCKVNYNRLVYYDSLSRPFVEKLIDIFEAEINKRKINTHKLDYIKWLVSCNQEFVKIKSVEVFNNVDKKPVYDIELNPCKFFIAGNKPMNVFDTIRKFTKEPWSPIQIMHKKTLSAEMLAYLWLLMEYEKNVMVIGGTGAGKTTMVNCIAFFIPPQARIVSIEDTRELQLYHENWLPSVARAGIGISGQKQGEVSLFDLLKESFRQRPDYVIVGEIRGKEAYVLFQGMSSGHPSMGTMHAEDVRTMIKRLETPPINLSPALVESMDAVCVMTHTKVRGESKRKLGEIDEILEVGENGKAKKNVVFLWDPKKDDFYFKSQSKVFENIETHYGIPKEKLYNEFKLRTLLLKRLYQKGIKEFREVQKIIHEYYGDPEKVLKRFKII